MADKPFPCGDCSRRFATEQGLNDHWRDKHHSLHQQIFGHDAEDSKDWGGECCVCGSSPCVSGTDLCGPCCFGEAETVGGNW